MEFRVKVDWNDGEAKVTKSGHYRFSLLIMEGGKEFGAIHGFRANEACTVLLPPQSTYGGGRFHFTVVELSPEMQTKVLTAVSRMVYGDSDG